MKRMSTRRIAQAKNCFAALGAITTRSQFGGYGLLAEGVMFAVIAEGAVFAGYGKHGTRLSRPRNGQYGLFQTRCAHYLALLLG